MSLAEDIDEGLEIERNNRHHAKLSSRALIRLRSRLTGHIWTVLPGSQPDAVWIVDAKGRRFTTTQRALEDRCDVEKR